MGANPLYLDAGPERISLDEGSALRVRRSGQPDGRFPLGRLTRVVSRAATEWDLDALLACADRGIPVLFQERHGEPRALFTGYRAVHQARFRERIQELVDRPDWAALFENWHRAERHRVIEAALESLDLSREDPRPAWAERELERLHQRRAPWGQVRALRRAFAGLARALAVEQVAQAGLPPHLAGDARAGLDLAGVLAELSRWDLEDVVYAQAVRGPHRRRVLEMFHAREGDLRAQGREALQRLNHWLREMAYERP